jgi:hypothetical protein
VEYQVCQTATGAEVWATGRPGDPADIEGSITGELQRLGVREPVVTVRVVDRLERQQTGKMRRFVPLTTADV